MFEGFDNTVKNSLSFLDNEFVTAGLYLFLILYAGLAAPQLPSYIAKLFDYTLFKTLIFFLIIYVSKKNPSVAIIAAIAVMVSLMTLNRLKFGQEMMSLVKRENYGDLNVQANCANGGDATCGCCDKCGCGITVENQVGRMLDNGVAGYDEFDEDPHHMLQYGGRHNVENALRRSEEVSGEKYIEGMQRMATLHEQSVSGVSSESHALVSSEQSEEESKKVVSMEELAEEVRSRSHGNMSQEELRSVCANVVQEYRENANRNRVKQYVAANTEGVWANEGSQHMYASAGY